MFDQRPLPVGQPHTGSLAKMRVST